MYICNVMNKKAKNSIIAEAKSALKEFNVGSNHELTNKAYLIITEQMEGIKGALDNLRLEQPEKYINAICRLKTTFLPELPLQLEDDLTTTKIEFIVSDKIQLGDFSNKK